MFKDILVGDTVNATAPVQGQLMVGEPREGGYGGNLEMRWFALYPTADWSSSYFTPVGQSSVAGDRTSVWLYNDGVSAIDVNWETKTGTGGPPLVVDPKESVRFDIPGDTGVHFWSAGHEPFFAVSTVNAADNDPNGTDNDTWDWGFALIPEDQLTTQALVGWGPGNSNVPPKPVSPTGVQNGNPVWVTPTATTTVYWDFDGDPATGVSTHGSGPLTGQKYDGSALVARLGSRKIFDESDWNQTGLRVYSLDTPLAVAWGEDPDSAGTSNPFLDAGSAVRPLPSYSISKTARAAHAEGQDDPDGLVSPGDFLLYTVTITSEGSGAVRDVVLKDVLPAHVAYVAGTTRRDGAAVADDGSPRSAFPLDETGLALGTLPALGRIEVSFLVQVAVVHPTFPVTEVVNRADVTTSNAGDQDAEVETPVIDPKIAIEKTVYRDGAGSCPGGELVRGLNGTPVVYCFRVVNTGNTYLASVTLTDGDLEASHTFAGVLAPFGAGEASWAEAGAITADLLNQADVVGTPCSSTGTPILNAPFVEATDTASVDLVHPAIDIQKTPDTQTVVSGGTATFTITVTNTGDVPLTNVTVTDPLAPTCDKGIGDLAVGAANGVTYTCTLAVVTADLTNVASVAGTPLEGGPVTDSDTAAVDVIHPAIDIQKTPDNQTVVSGGTATFTITVTNTGDVPLTDVTVTDPLAPTCDKGIGDLAVGAANAVTYTCTLAVVTADLTNVASVAGTSLEGGPVTDSDTAAVDVIHPAIDIQKTPDTQTVVSGGTATFTITVTNTGDVPLTNVTVTDPLAPTCDKGIGVPRGRRSRTSLPTPAPWPSSPPT